MGTAKDNDESGVLRVTAEELEELEDVDDEEDDDILLDDLIESNEDAHEGDEE